MPTIYRFEGLRFFFYSNEGNEPPHVHVTRGDCELKIWLHNLVIENNYGFKISERRIILKIVKKQKHQFLEKWNKFYE